MKNKNQRDLQKHWAEQARKKSPAEQLRAKAEKLREKMEKERALSSEGRSDTVALPESPVTAVPPKSKQTANTPTSGNGNSSKRTAKSR